ncbi:MAG: hypothetical protein N5P05_000846 [Chroococcopsis gigantea SAG 12.99]|jgi:hypothetical protein|nr:YdcF family protein [Chlorogloea purpurea SAG 13.99]MDV2999240.1 hypothetical protein [Chroococcopsis gigantea SAG 12.99]
MPVTYQEMFWGLLEYKPQWSLTWKAWLILIGFLSALIVLVINKIPEFLAIVSPIEADALLIEGWAGDPVIEGGVQEFFQGNYKFIITTGFPLYRGSFLLPYKSYAELAKVTAIKLGVEPDKVEAIPTSVVDRDRTAAAALAVKDWLLKSDAKIKSLNIYSFDVHTRRSYLIYKKVLGDDFLVGAIAYLNKDYDHQRWWASSMGFRYIIEESLAYIYARLIWYFTFRD